MKSLAKRTLGLALILFQAKSAAAGAYVAVGCRDTHIFDLNPSTNNFRVSIVKESGDRLESFDTNISKRIESIDSELAILSFKDQQGQLPVLKINQSLGESGTTQLRKVKIVNRGIDTLSEGRKVDLVLEIGTQNSGSYQTLKYLDCKMYGGRVNALESDSWIKAFKIEH